MKEIDPMIKPLSEMTTEELGKLFPIILTAYNPYWPMLYLSEKYLIEQTMGADIIARISHVGSTSVPGLTAKPTVDILLEIKNGTEVGLLKLGFERIGYQYSPQPDNPEPHMMFMKGYSHNGFIGQAYHVHVRYKGDWDELYFRDYIAAHSDTAAEYVQLKQTLKKRFEHDREAYTKGKTEFITAATRMAREELAGRYKD